MLLTSSLPPNLVLSPGVRSGEKCRKSSSRISSTFILDISKKLEKHKGRVLTMNCQNFGRSDEYLETTKFWSSLPDLLPLIKCLPQDAWFEKQSIDDGCLTIVELVRPLQDDDVELCKKCAGKVKRLGYLTTLSDDQFSVVIHHEDGTEVQRQRQVWELSPSFYDALEHHGIIPLPSLESFLVRSEVDFITINRIAGPNTTVLEFTPLGYKSAFYSHPRPEIVPLPNSLHALLLQESHPLLKDEISASLVHSFTEMTQLEILHLPHCGVSDGNDLCMIFSSPVLRELELGLFTSHHLQFVPSKSPQRLRHLQVMVEDLMDCYKLFMKIGPVGTSQLKSLKLELILRSQDKMAGNIKLFFESLTYLCDLNVLSVFSFRLSWSFQPDRDLVHSITLETIRPLFAFRHLRVIRIRKEKDGIRVFSVLSKDNYVGESGY